MKKSLFFIMKVLSSAVLLALIAPVMINAQESKANFEGTWALNTMKSSPSASNSSGSLVVNQDMNKFTTTLTDENGAKVTSKYTLDGKECINKSGGIEKKSTAKFSDEGKVLTIVSRYEKDGQETTERSIWSLNDPKTLSIEQTVSGTSGDEVTRYVYDKK